MFELSNKNCFVLATTGSCIECYKVSECDFIGCHLKRIFNCLHFYDSETLVSLVVDSWIHVILYQWCSNKGKFYG